MRCRAIALTVICLCGSIAGAAPLLNGHVLAVVKTWVKNGDLSSAVIGMIDRDETAVYGFGTVGSEAPNAQTVYEIGSVTKTFTALLLANYVMAGSVTLDEPVAKLLPDYVIPEFANKSITLLDLATHSSCLPDTIGTSERKQSENPYAFSVAELKSFLATYHLPCEPGSTFLYSNVGFGLLTQALVAHTKTSYADLVEQQITTPLGMTSTRIELTPTMQSRLALGHHADGSAAQSWDFDALQGTGALRSNVQDLMRYVQAHMRSVRADTTSYALVQKPQRPTTFEDTQIGLTWRIKPIHGQSIVWHQGRTGGYASFVGFTADGQRGVVILTNTATEVDYLGFNSLVPYRQ